MCLACTSFFRETVSKVRHLKSLTFYPSISAHCCISYSIKKIDVTQKIWFLPIPTLLSVFTPTFLCFWYPKLNSSPGSWICTPFWLGSPYSMVLFSTCLFLLHWLFSLSIWTCSNLCVFLKKPVAVLVFFFPSLAKRPGGVARLSSLAHLPFSLNPLQSGLMLITSLNTSILF